MTNGWADVINVILVCYFYSGKMFEIYFTLRKVFFANLKLLDERRVTNLLKFAFEDRFDITILILHIVQLLFFRSIIILLFQITL